MSKVAKSDHGYPRVKVPSFVCILLKCGWRYAKMPAYIAGWLFGSLKAPTIKKDTVSIKSMQYRGEPSDSCSLVAKTWAH